MVSSQSCGYSLFPGGLSPERSGSKWQGLVAHVLCGSNRPQSAQVLGQATGIPGHDSSPCFFVFSVVPWEFLNSSALPT